MRDQRVQCLWCSKVVMLAKYETMYKCDACFFENLNPETQKFVRFAVREKRNERRRPVTLSPKNA